MTARIAALFLVLPLALPNSAFALRPSGLEESDPAVKRDLVAHLTEAPVVTGNEGVFPRGSNPAHVFTPAAAGLEEQTGGIYRVGWKQPFQRKFTYYRGRQVSEIIEAKEGEVFVIPTATQERWLPRLQFGEYHLVKLVGKREVSLVSRKGKLPGELTTRREEWTPPSSRGTLGSSGFYVARTSKGALRISRPRISSLSLGAYEVYPATPAAGLEEGVFVSPLAHKRVKEFFDAGLRIEEHYGRTGMRGEGPMLIAVALQDGRLVAAVQLMADEKQRELHLDDFNNLLPEGKEFGRTFLGLVLMSARARWPGFTLVLSGKARHLTNVFHGWMKREWAFQPQQTPGQYEIPRIHPDQEAAFRAIARKTGWTATDHPEGITSLYLPFLFHTGIQDQDQLDELQKHLATPQAGLEEDKELIRRLRDSSGSFESLSEAAMRLAWKGTPQAIAGLRAVAADPASQPKNQAAAAMGLGLHGDPEHLDSLLEAFVSVGKRTGRGNSLPLMLVAKSLSWLNYTRWSDAAFVGDALQKAQELSGVDFSQPYASVLVHGVRLIYQEVLSAGEMPADLVRILSTHPGISRKDRESILTNVGTDPQQRRIWAVTRLGELRTPFAIPALTQALKAALAQDPAGQDPAALQLQVAAVEALARSVRAEVGSFADDGPMIQKLKKDAMDFSRERMDPARLSNPILRRAVEIQWRPLWESGSQAGLEETEFRSRISSMAGPKEIPNFLTKEWQEGRDPVPLLMSWFSDGKAWTAFNSPVKKTAIFGWLFTFIDRLGVSSSSREGFYRFFRYAATRPNELPSIQSWAVRTMQILARRPAEKEEVLQITDLLWGESLDWSDSKTSIRIPFQRDLVRAAHGLDTPEAKAWIRNHRVPPSPIRPFEPPVSPVAGLEEGGYGISHGVRLWWYGAGPTRKTVAEKYGKEAWKKGLGLTILRLARTMKARQLDYRPLLAKSLPILVNRMDSAQLERSLALAVRVAERGVDPSDLLTLLLSTAVRLSRQAPAPEQAFDEMFRAVERVVDLQIGDKARLKNSVTHGHELLRSPRLSPTPRQFVAAMEFLLELSQAVDNESAWSLMKNKLPRMALEPIRARLMGIHYRLKLVQDPASAVPLVQVQYPGTVDPPHGNAPRELESPIDWSHPDKVRQRQELLEAFRQCQREWVVLHQLPSVERAVTAARRVNPDFISTVPQIQVSNVIPVLDQLLREVNWQIFLPAGELVKLSGFLPSGEPLLAVNEIQEPWQGRTYLGLPAWRVRLAASEAPEKDQAAGTALHGIAFSRLEALAGTAAGLYDILVARDQTGLRDPIRGRLQILFQNGVVSKRDFMELGAMEAPAEEDAHVEDILFAAALHQKDLRMAPQWGWFVGESNLAENSFLREMWPQKEDDWQWSSEAKQKMVAVPELSAKVRALIRMMKSEVEGGRYERANAVLLLHLLVEVRTPLEPPPQPALDPYRLAAEHFVKGLVEAGIVSLEPLFKAGILPTGTDILRPDFRVDSTLANNICFLWLEKIEADGPQSFQGFAERALADLERLYGRNFRDDRRRQELLAQAGLEEPKAAFVIPQRGLPATWYTKAGGAEIPSDWLDILDPERERILAPLADIVSGTRLFVQNGTLPAAVLAALREFGREAGVEVQEFGLDNVPQADPSTENVYVLDVPVGSERSEWIRDGDAIVINLRPAAPDGRPRTPQELGALINVAREAAGRLLQVGKIYRSDLQDAIVAVDTQL